MDTLVAGFTPEIYRKKYKTRMLEPWKAISAFLGLCGQTAYKIYPWQLARSGVSNGVILH